MTQFLVYLIMAIMGAVQAPVEEDIPDPARQQRWVDARIDMRRAELVRTPTISEGAWRK